MQFGICLLSAVPARKEPSGTSEMVTQLLFGDTYQVLEITENWFHIKTAFDHYPCWISSKQHQKISSEVFSKIQKEVPVYTSALVHPIKNKTTGLSFPITTGARLPFYKNRQMSFEQFQFEFDGETTSGNVKQTTDKLIQTSLGFLNAPYLWGGKSPFGIDCSGFVQTVFKLNGLVLPRDAWQQVDLGDALSFVEEAETGDLAFFDNEEGKIVHVGILLNSNEIIHASGCVRIDKLDHYGIFNTNTKKYSHTLRVIKRVL